MQNLKGGGGPATWVPYVPSKTQHQTAIIAIVLFIWLSLHNIVVQCYLIMQLSIERHVSTLQGHQQTI